MLSAGRRGDRRWFATSQSTNEREHHRCSCYPHDSRKEKAFGRWLSQRVEGIEGTDDPEAVVLAYLRQRQW